MQRQIASSLTVLGLAFAAASCSSGGHVKGGEPDANVGPDTDASSRPDGGSDGTGDGGEPVPEQLPCPAPLMVSNLDSCDGVKLTAASSIDTKSDGITETAGPAGAVALRVSDGQSLDLVDKGCLQLGKDGGDFSLSMWLKATGASQIIGTTDQYGQKQGFILWTKAGSDGSLTLSANSASSTQNVASVTSAPFAANEWVHVAVRYDNRGDAAMVTLDVNLAETAGTAAGNVYNPNWRVGDQGWGSIAPFEVSGLVSYGRPLSDHEVKALFLTNAAAVGLSKTEVSTALTRLDAHIGGTATLNPSALRAEVDRLTKNAAFLDTDAGLTEQALALVDTYESKVGPLFMTDATKHGFSRVGTDGDELDLARAMATVQQTVLEHVFTEANVSHCGSMLDGKRFKTADYFPGVAPPPEDPKKAYEVTISANLPAFWGRPVAFATEPARRPTGLYLSPGSVGRVTVPAELVNAGYSVLVGAHTVDASIKTTLKRLDRVSKLYPITQRVTSIANPLGGGVYIVVPYLAKEGLVKVSISGVIEAPFFSQKSFDTTTHAQWLTRRAAKAPWADFETDKFMMQVPTGWIYAFDDPAPLMQKWDSAMDGVSELLGYPPEKRNRTVLYEQLDVQPRFNGIYGIGYPQVNNSYDPLQKVDGNSNSWLLTDPTAFELDYHELGHAQLFSKFRGEEEADVNFLIAYVRNVKFGVDFQQAFKESFGPSYGSPGVSLDDAAINWMLTDNFRNGRDMDYTSSTKNEFRYQQRGYAKYGDVYVLFGWNALRDFWHQENLDYNTKAGPYTPGGDGLDPVDSRILRMSVAAGADLRPLIHFWGIRPVDNTALAAKLQAAGIGPSQALKQRLQRYMTVAPKNSTDLMAHYTRLFPTGCPTSTDPTYADYGCGWYQVFMPKFNATLAAQIQTQVQAVITQYFP